MSDSLVIKSNAASLLRRFDKLPKEIRTGVRKGLARALLLVEDRVRRKTDVTARRGAAGLMGRLTSHVRVGGPIAIDGVIGFRKRRGFPYELAQEYGAKAKPGGAMAIPVSPKARRMSERGIGPRDAFGDDLFVPKNTHVLAQKNNLSAFQSGKGAFTVHYVLVKSISPRLKFRETVTGSGDLISREVVKGAKQGSAAE